MKTEKRKFVLEKSSVRDNLWALKGIRIPVLPLLLIFAMAMLSAYASMNISLFTGSMVDANGDVPTRRLVSFAITYLLVGTAAAGTVIASAFASEKINLGLRVKLWRKIMYTKQNCYDTDSGETFVSRVTADCDFASKLITVFVQSLATCVTLGIYIHRMFQLNQTLAVAMLWLVPVSVLFGWAYARLHFVIAQKTQAMLSGTTTYLVEHTKSLNLIKISGTQVEETEKGLEHFDRQYVMQIKTGLMTLVYNAMQRLFEILSLLIPFVIGAQLVNDNVIRAGVVIAFYSLARIVGNDATTLINDVGTIRQANGALSRVIRVLRLPDERGMSGLSMDVPDQDITIEEVSFSYLGNIKWTSNSIVQILRNERHCGDVLTRKTYTPNFRDHLSKKNRGQRPQSRYFNHHEAIVSRDDFNAVQRMLDNAKYGNKSLLPELRVIDSGMLKGFVSINPRWAGFKEKDYYMAAKSVYATSESEEVPSAQEPAPIQIEVEAGDFDLRGFEITRSEFFDSYRRPVVTFGDRRIKFSTACVRKFGEKNRVELLVNPIERRFAVRPTDNKNRNAVVISKANAGVFYPREIASSAFIETLFNLFDWNLDHKYRIIGSLYEQDGEVAYIFEVKNSEAFFKSYILPRQTTTAEGSQEIQPLMPSGKHIRAIPEEWTTSFGRQFYQHEQDISALEAQSEQDWKLRLEGQLFETGKKLNVTGFDELRTYIKQSLSTIAKEETTNE